jgi:ACS family hexuronate transporter-like MFS transporter
MNLLLTPTPGSWRFIFQGVGVCGLLWIGFWLVLVPRGQLGVKTMASDVASSPQSGGGNESFWRVILSRRFLIILAVISLINTTFQLLRAWLPKFLIEGRGYAESAALNFNALFYIATDVGCIGAGAATLWLYRRGRTAQGARVTVFAICAALTALSALAAMMPKGPALLGVLLLMGAGALGLFPTYHALTQELSPTHQGKVTGLAGVVAWAIGSPSHIYLGRWVDKTGSFDGGLALAGCLPLLAFLLVWMFWGKEKAGPGASAVA